MQTTDFLTYLFSPFAIEINLIILDVIVLLMDQVSYLRLPKNTHLILIILMSLALMFLSVEFEK